MTDLSAAFAGIKQAQEDTSQVRPGRTQKAKKQPKAEQIELEGVSRRPIQPMQKKAWKHGTGKSSQEGYERLTVYVRKDSKDNLERSLIGTGQDMSDVVQQLLDSHLGT